jgi:hypothetical protein
VLCVDGYGTWELWLAVFHNGMDVGNEEGCAMLARCGVFCGMQGFFPW